ERDQRGGEEIRQDQSLTRWWRIEATASLLVEPGDHESAAVVEADVRAEVLHVRLPRRHRARRNPIAVIDLLGTVTLDVPDDVATLGDVDRPALEAAHLREAALGHPRAARHLSRHI